MKIERLLGIITFLLNRDVVKGKYLAEKFEVSERTIQRDVESINMAGIPIVSLRGVSGGYKILDTYRLSKQTATDDDLKSMRSALETWNSAFDNEKGKSTLEKVNSLVSSSQLPYLTIDFSVAKENKKVLDYLSLIEGAICNQFFIEFMYTNASNEAKRHVIEPVNLKFKWYAWYLIGYHSEKKQYRVYKLSRMTELIITERKYSTVHCDKTDYFEELMQQDTRKSSKLIVKCNKSVFVSFSEYFNAIKIISENDSFLLVELEVIDTERHWFASILSYGDDVEIIEPFSMRERFLSHSKKIFEMYNKPDR